MGKDWVLQSNKIKENLDTLLQYFEWKRLGTAIQHSNMNSVSLIVCYHIID